MIKNYAEFLNSDFLKVPHHGSKTSTTSDFLKKVTPEVAFIPTSIPNKFNLPDLIVLNRLDSLKVKYWISGNSGALIIDEKGVTSFK